ncbi:hypothetical protein N657DRAFT_157568 [Parathielavia appendiculata]|uniref:Uncharacterized protein n=1 Tax=Parathielavia appendiculata TaxID=2587402 RepID=A0AAN6TTP6_9PEZI|nr:hypothetical protein N657DRAFT_157568 [Parathielavia appendiculata]
MPLTCAVMLTLAKRSPHCSLASLLLRQGASAKAVATEIWTSMRGLASYSSSENIALPPKTWEGIVPLVWELVSRGAPLDKESTVLLGSFGYALAVDYG